MTYDQEETVFKVVATIVVVLMLWLFSVVAFKLAAHAKCLESGYPEVKIAWNYKTYCVNLDGMVVGKVVTVKSLQDSDETN